MRIGVVQFPGSCDERDAVRALVLLGAEPVLIRHDHDRLDGVDAVVLPGGFTYGDYLRTGALAQFAPIMSAVAAFAERGGRVLGICNGFQVLCEAGLLPGALVRNVGLRFVHRRQPVRVERTGPWLAAPTGAVLELPIKHGEGRYVVDDPDGLAASGQVLLRYCDADGAVTDAANPNGSVRGIAGVTNRGGNVAGLMPHPEHAVEALLGPTDGRAVLGTVGTPGSVRAGAG
ncbi:phosphoribosylformylglycinamidine synthase subunit PurQ [Egibacter rhizosphaerae]|uniref:Phosphoribosylformylglycinamidine synthase subunit PurQ n=1 Tax=Egibacter rhizosphaerae TaxID=1670831 RepID=A0A411YG23_9ACTN|nr:phosphoribosylformylglycinamidine synthase subunit PurQ [Egibacter rhizosphaerae]QBI20180.1 phosphoribosylformylglycinamidine synthase subunit PurQ [Egibacter rhizosphaerae]